MDCETIKFRKQVLAILTKYVWSMELVCELPYASLIASLVHCTSTGKPQTSTLNFNPNLEATTLPRPMTCKHDMKPQHPEAPAPSTLGAQSTLGFVARP